MTSGVHPVQAAEADRSGAWAVQAIILMGTGLGFDDLAVQLGRQPDEIRDLAGRLRCAGALDDIYRRGAG